MVWPVRGLPLTLYLISTRKSIDALLAQEVDKVERPVYYLTELSRGRDELTLGREYCLTLIFVMQKLSHYFLTHPLN